MEPGSRRLTWDLSGNVSEIKCFINSKFITKVKHLPRTWHAGDARVFGGPKSQQSPKATSGSGVAAAGVLVCAWPWNVPAGGEGCKCVSVIQDCGPGERWRATVLSRGRRRAQPSPRVLVWLPLCAHLQPRLLLQGPQA